MPSFWTANNFISRGNYRSEGGGQKHRSMWTATFWVLNLGRGARGGTFSSTLFVCLDLLGFLIFHDTASFYGVGEKTFRNRSIPGWISSLPRKWGKKKKKNQSSPVIGQFDWRQVVLSCSKQSHKASFGFKHSSPALSFSSTTWKLAPQMPTINLVPVSLTSTLSVWTIFSKLDNAQTQSWPGLSLPPPLTSTPHPRP